MVHKRDHTSNLLGTGPSFLFFTENNSVESHPGCCVPQYVSLFIAEQDFMAGTNHSLLSHSPIQGHLGSSQHLAMMSKAAMNSRAQVWCEADVSVAHLTEEETDAQRSPITCSK